MWDCNPVSLYTEYGIPQQDGNSSAGQGSSYLAVYGNRTDDTVDQEWRAETELYKEIEQTITSKVTVPICVFGILGNVLNLVVLTRKGLQKSMDRMERSAHTGLIALAISDMCFCLALLPNAWVKLEVFIYPRRNFDLFYRVYSEGVLNMFIMSSTWLTVAMATSRYLAICHPLRAREIIGMTFARSSIAVVFIFCVIFNLPRFWRQSIDSMRCMEGGMAYFPVKGFIQTHPVFGTVYMWLYFSIGIIGPLLVLAYCNAHLVRALRRSTAMRRQYQTNNVASDGTHRITLTLVIIVVMYILLVGPAEIINFLQQTAISDASSTHQYNLAVAIVNTLEALNFAFNFVLYCAINVHFRQTVREIFCFCCASRQERQSGFRSSRTCYDSVTMTTTTGIVMKNIGATDVWQRLRYTLGTLFNQLLQDL